MVAAHGPGGGQRGAGTQARGRGGCHQVGNGTTTTELRPVKIWNSGVIAIAAGAFHSLALFYDGTVLAWDDGVFGTGTRGLVPYRFLASATSRR
jgi:alpha-tubulin suppressor-like RCC1 family protein